MYIGRTTIGTYIPLSVWCRNGSQTPVVPDRAPLVSIYSATAKIAEFRLPIRDRYVVTGYFQGRLFLGGGLYSTGPYQARFAYAISGTAYTYSQEWEIVAGGHDDGAGLSMHYFKIPTTSFVIYQGEGGRVLRRRNPTV